MCAAASYAVHGVGKSFESLKLTFRRAALRPYDGCRRSQNGEGPGVGDAE